MTKRQKALVILATPFVLGFIIGFAIGGGFSSGSGRDSGSDSSCVSSDIVSSADKSDIGLASSSASSDSAISKTESGSGASAEIEYSESDEWGSSEDDVDGLGQVVERKEIIYYGKRLSYAKLFADLNDDHIATAKKVGLATIPQVRNQVRKSMGLVEVVDNEYLVVDDLNFSVPYLVKGAHKQLNRIAKAFADSLKAKDLLDYKLVVSSLLRTEEDVNRLRRSGNPNASDNSAHCYGTTFDITYTRYFREDESESFMQPYELTKVLGEVLLAEKKAGRILVKYEKKEHCFHITSTMSE